MGFLDNIKDLSTELASTVDEDGVVIPTAPDAPTLDEKLGLQLQTGQQIVINSNNGDVLIAEEGKPYKKANINTGILDRLDRLEAYLFGIAVVPKLVYIVFKYGISNKISTSNVDITKVTDADIVNGDFNQSGVIRYNNLVKYITGDISVTFGLTLDNFDGNQFIFGARNDGDGELSSFEFGVGDGSADLLLYTYGTSSWNPAVRVSDYFISDGAEHFYGISLNATGSLVCMRDDQVFSVIKILPILNFTNCGEYQTGKGYDDDWAKVNGAFRTLSVMDHSITFQEYLQLKSENDNS